MKKSLGLIISAAAGIGLAAVLLRKKSKTNLKITCKCGENSDEIEHSITSEDTNDEKIVNIDLPAQKAGGTINLALSNLSIGNVTYKVIIK